MLVDVWAYCQKKSKSSKLCLDEILWETLWCQLNITRLSDAHTQRAFFSEGLLSWLGSRDLLETLAFPETLNWSQKGVCCLQTSSHLLKLCRKPISHSRAQTVTSFVAYGSFSAIWLIVEDTVQIQTKISTSLLWQLRNHTVPECKNQKLGLCICRQMWDCTNASWSVVWIPALKVNNSEELSNPVWHGGKWVTFSYAKHGKTNKNYNYGHVILL